MSQWIYLDGEFVKKEDAKVSIFDHGLLYGDGIFEGIRAYNGRVFKLDEHIRRLYDCAKVICLEIPMTPEEMKEMVVESCARNNLSDAYIRLVITRGVGDLGLNPYLCKKATIFCIAASIQLYPAELYENGLKIVTVPTTRNFVDALNPRIKSLNYLNNVMAKIEAIQSGVPEALMLNTQGFVAECTGDNVFLIRDGELITPDIACGALKGITRDCVMELAEKRGMKVREAFMTRFDVYTADECFLTGTAAEVIPVVEVDTRKIGDGTVGKITSELIQDFRALTKVDGPEIPLEK
jgi:branched-chain amino acid aminotransferase